MSAASRLAKRPTSDHALTHLERCLLRLGRVCVDTQSASRGRDAVMSLAERGLMSTSHDGNGAVLVGEITYAGRRFLAWIEETPATALN